MSFRSNFKLIGPVGAALVMAMVAGAGFFSARSEPEARAPLPTRTPNLEIMTIAHRGVKKIAPENTLPAIAKAIILGYDYVELDVRYTRDGVPVLMHDDWIDRTTSGAGPVARYDLATLQRLDAGFWKGREYIGARVPSLDQALELMAGRIKLYLDQKQLPTPELLRALREHGFEGDNLIVVGGGDKAKAFLELEPGAPVMPGLDRAEELGPLLERFPSARAVNTDCRSLTAEMVTAAHERGLMVFTNVLSVAPGEERECMRRPLELGSDAVQFDNLPLFFEVREEMKREAATPPDRFVYLCPDADDPERAADKVLIQCELESGSFAPPTITPRSTGELKIAAYNLERGMYLDEQIAVFQRHPEFQDADVLLIGEADRYCSRVGYRNVARDLAQALQMDYVFGVEYVELPRRADQPVNDNRTVCEHGNAILSRYPLANAEQIRHQRTINWYLPPGPERDNAEPRLGGAITLAADVIVDGRPVRVYSVHLDSDISREAVENRTSQARDLVEHSAQVKGPVIMGGDFNTINYTMDLMTGTRSDRAVEALVGASYTDAHSMLPVSARGTTGREYLVRGIIDLIFVRDLEVVESGLCAPSTCGHLSDHLPVWTRVKLENREGAK